MFTKLGSQIARRGALCVFALILCVSIFIGLFAVISDSYASGAVPLPHKKPISAAPAMRGELIQYSLKDFSKALLAYGAPPLPTRKPILSARGEEIVTTDAQKYQSIFALQAKGKIGAAQKKMATLDDQRLRGHVLYQRYMHPTAYTSNFDELHSWLALYGDHPGADKIYKLAKRKKPADFSGDLPKPKKYQNIARRPEPWMVSARRYKPSKKRSAAQKKETDSLKKSVRALVHQTRLTQALDKLRSSDAADLLDQVEYDALQSLIAQGYLHAGKIDKAYDLAAQSAQRSGLYVPNAGWVAGLAAWAREDYSVAARHFEIMARSSYASGWSASGGAYWAARAHMKDGKKRQVKEWLERAATHPRTFYGLIATRALGRDFNFNWAYPSFTQAHSATLRDNEVGARAMALVAANQNHLAEAELLRLKPKTPEMTEALLAYAGHAGLPALSLRLGGAYEAPEGLSFDAALYPKGSWKAEDAFSVDAALVHAIMRQESRFDHRAESYSGARGLMQLMPATARHVAGKTVNEELLIDPVYNLELGEKYLTELMGMRNVDGDLLSLLVAYNAGPGNLSRWKREWDSIDDPLLFIELIPARETRAYVEHVLSNYWIYRMRDGEKTPTLNALAKGKAARYAAADEGTDDAQKKSSPFRIALNR